MPILVHLELARKQSVRGSATSTGRSLLVKTCHRRMSVLPASFGGQTALGASQESGMSNETDPKPEPAGARRADTVWKASNERIAERNQEARKAAKQQRAAHELRQAERRREAELRERAELLRMAKPS
jgi:hypothetical protein